MTSVTAAPDAGVRQDMAPTDDDLVRRVTGGDAGSYAILVERYYERSLRFGLRMLGNRADAEEAVQNAFVRVYRALDKYDARSRFESWLFQIVANQCRTLGAKRRRRERTFVPIDATHDFGEPPAAAEVYRSMDVQRALDQLSPDQREALLMFYMEDRSYEDIADVTGLGVSALKMRVKRAREQLRKALEGAYDG